VERERQAKQQAERDAKAKQQAPPSLPPSLPPPRSPSFDDPGPVPWLRPPPLLLLQNTSKVLTKNPPSFPPSLPPSRGNVEELATFVIENQESFSGCLDKLLTVDLDHDRLDRVLKYLATFIRIPTICRLEEGEEEEEGGGRKGRNNKIDREKYTRKLESGLCSKKGCQSIRAQNIRGGSMTGQGGLCEEYHLVLPAPAHHVLCSVLVLPHHLLLPAPAHHLLLPALYHLPPALLLFYSYKIQAKS